MKFNAECWKQRRAVLALVTSLLTACATVSSEPVAGVCPPVVEYSAGFQARAAEEVAMLPQSSAAVEMLKDYAITRELTRVCSRKPLKAVARD